MSDNLIPRIPIGQSVADGVDWITSTFRPIFNAFRDVALAGFDAFATVFTGPPFWVVALVLAALAFVAKGWKLALGSLLGFAIIEAVGLWDKAMVTLALVLLSAVVALLLSLPLGIWAARNDRVSAVVRPILDFMQTMPAFVYLIPTVVIFSAGAVPGILATVVFAMAPGVRFTELGIRQVDKEVVEAGHAFGSTPGRILRQIQLPLALPTIMAGINQVIMLALSMVVIGGMVGAGGLGNDIVNALQRVNLTLGVEAGLSVVILAIFLDRVTSALSARTPVSKALQATSA